VLSEWVIVTRDRDARVGSCRGAPEVTARRHPVPDLIEIVLKLLLEGRDGLPVHPRRSLAYGHPSIALKAAPNDLRLQYWAARR